MVLPLCFMASCKKEPIKTVKEIIADSCYSSIYDDPLYDKFKSDLVELKEDYRAIYTHDTCFMFCPKSDLEIQYELSTRYRLSDAVALNIDTSTIPMLSKYFLISVKSVNNIRKAFFIIWTNADSIGKSIRYYHPNLNIGNHTNSIVTNLSKSTFEKLFPEYCGNFQKKDSVEITVNHQYSFKYIKAYWREINYSNMDDVYLLDSMSKYFRNQMDFYFFNSLGRK